MKKVPETIELDQNDMADAINFWLQKVHSNETHVYYEVEFAVTGDLKNPVFMAKAMKYNDEQ